MRPFNFTRSSKRIISSLALALFLVFQVSCGADFKDVSSDNGRQAILDEANNFLTAGLCDSAINVLRPLVQSSYSNAEALMIYASAYACKGGLNVVAQVLSLQEVRGSDIWSPIIKSNFSSGSADGKTNALVNAVDIVRQTAVVPGSTEGFYLTSEANTYIIFLQINVIATVIAPLGRAEISNGHRTQSMIGAGSIADKCRIEVAFSAISDALNYSATSTGVTTLRNAINQICTGALGGSCPTGDSYEAYLLDPLQQAQGQLLINAIDSQWTS